MPLRSDTLTTRRFERELLGRGVSLAEFAERHGLPSRTVSRIARSGATLRHVLVPALREALAAEGLDPDRALRRCPRPPEEHGIRVAVWRGERVAALVVKRLGVSLRGMAREVGISHATLHHLLSGYTLTHKRRSSATAADARKARVAAFLANAGATGAEIATLWEPAGELPEDGNPLPDVLRRLVEEGRPVLSEKVLDAFSLSGDPFTSRLLGERERPFKGHHWVRAKARLARAVRQQEMVALVGPVGSGKTELWRTLERELREEGRFDFIFLRDPTQERVSSQQIVEAILEEIGGRKTPLSRQRRLRALREQLAGRREQDRVVTLVVEEGQLMCDENLRTFKGLNELYHGFTKLLGVVVIAQLQIHDLLKSQAVEEVRRRLPVVEYRGLASTEIGAYLEHRLGYVRRGKARVFDDSALSVLEKLAKSREARDVISAPLALGNVAARAMEIAVERRGRKVVGAEDVEEALRQGDRA